MWLPIRGYEGVYEVSNLGNVRSLDRYCNGRWPGSTRFYPGRKLNPTPLRYTRGPDYLVVTLRYNGSRDYKKVHHLVAEAFLGPRPEGLLIRHLNGDGGDNRAENLAYGTHAENAADAIRHGTYMGPAPTSHCKRGHPRPLDREIGEPCRECIDYRLKLRKEKRRASDSWGRSKNQKITEDQAREIIKRARRGESHASISLDYPISRRHVSDIVAGVCWKHLHEEGLK